jgi:hypothetical protein
MTMRHSPIMLPPRGSGIPRSWYDQVTAIINTVFHISGSGPVNVQFIPGIGTTISLDTSRAFKRDAIPVRLTSRHSTDKHKAAWEEVERTSDGEWQTKDGGLKGEAGEDPAHEVNKSPGFHVGSDDGDVVWIRRVETVKASDSNDSPHQWIFDVASKVFPVKLDQTGGSNGNDKTQASYTYDMMDLDEAGDLATALTPEKARPDAGKLEHGDGKVGLGYMNEDNEPKLYDGNETLDGSAC